MTKLKVTTALVLLATMIAGSNPFWGKGKKTKEMVFELTCSQSPAVRFNDLPCGLFVSTDCEVDNAQIYDPSELPEKEQKKIRKKITFRFTPELNEFFTESFKKYVRYTGIPTGYDMDRDFHLNANLREYKIKDNIGTAQCQVAIEWELKNPFNQTILDGTATGRYTMSAGQSIVDALDKAYSRALEDINWFGIANVLKHQQKQENKRADQEKKKQVTGDGDTALEHTVIRWFITSSPAGADVSWRVVSSTPDVKNTNASYIGTTPYETTESFDIRGLKFENSGNIQIEVTCEKPGYLTQKRRFNLRQAIEQREISAKFNLVKESEE